MTWQSKPSEKKNATRDV